MSVVTGHPVADTTAGSRPQRPGWLVSVPLDAGLAVAAYLASYWLRFPADRLEFFLPGAWSTMPLVVGGQLAALVGARAYAARPRVDWLVRVTVGIVVGTIASSFLVVLALGFEGVSRIAFVADATLLWITTLGWRAAWALRAGSRARAAGGR